MESASKVVNLVHKTQEVTTDGWNNVLTRLGTSFDKSEATTHTRTPRKSFEVLDSVYRQDALAARIVDVIVDDSFRQGFSLKFKSGDIDADKVNDVRSRVMDWAKKIGLKGKVKRHLKQRRAFGGSVLVMGANDGGAPEDPLMEERITEFTFLQTLDRYQVSESGVLVTDPRSKDYGFPQAYFLNSVFIEGAGNIISADDLPDNQKRMMDNAQVHTSRLIRGDGTNVSDRSRLNNDGWGDSIIERVWTPLRSYNTFRKSCDHLMHDFSQGVYGIDNLATIVKQNGGAALMKRIEIMDQVASVLNAKLIDAGKESYTRSTTNIAGLPDMYDRKSGALAAAAGMPITLLFGVSPGGFGTGEAEGDNWDDVTQSYQEDEVSPILEEIFRLLFLTPEFADVPDEWSIDWNPLKQMSALQLAEIHHKQASADQIYVSMAVLSPEEVAQSRFGGEEYSVETQLDEETRTGDAPLTPEEEAEAAKLNEEAEAPEGEEAPEETASPEAADPGEAFNGAQVAALSGIVLQVVNSEIPFESAVQLVALAFPVDEAGARALLTPAEAMQAEVKAEKEANKAVMEETMGAAGPPPPPGQEPEEEGEEEPAQEEPVSGPPTQEP